MRGVAGDVWTFNSIQKYDVAVVVMWQVGACHHLSGSVWDSNN